jgi:hypothetical protein
MCVCTRIVLSRNTMTQPLETYLSYFSHILMITLIFHRIVIHLLLLYRLPCFVFFVSYFCVPLRTHANLVIGL